MANKRRIVVEFLGDDKTLGKTADRVEGRMGKLGGRLKTVGKVGALGLAAGAVVAGKALYDMGKQAADDQQQAKLLETALKNNAKATDEQVASTEKWITAQGKALGITDDKLRPALGDLVRATGDVKEAQRLASLAMDVSAGSGKDLGSVSKALAKAQNGNVSGLARLGIATKDANGKTKTFAQIQEDLAKKFKGSATKSADTFAGRMQRLRVMFDEAKESIGYKLLPIAEKLADWFVKTGLPAIKKFSDFLHDKLGPVFENIRDLFHGSTGGMNKDVKKNFEAIRDTIASVVSIIKSLWDRFGKTIMATAKAAFENIRKIIGGQLQIIAGIFKVFASLLKGDWSGVWAGLKQIASGALSVLKGVIGQALTAIKGLFKIAWLAITAVVGAAWSGIKSLVASGANGIVDAVRSIPGKIKALGGYFKSAGLHLIGQLVAGLKGAGSLISDIAGSVWSAVKKLLNSAIGKINAALEFKISLPGPDISVNPPNIPKLATGGIVKGSRMGTIIRAGENGVDEAVVPLSGRYAPRSASGGTQRHIIELRLNGRVLREILLDDKNLRGIALGLT